MLSSTEDSFSSTNSTQSRTTVDAASSNRTTVDSNVAANTRSTTNETLTDDSTLLRPVRTGRARQPQSYVSILHQFSSKNYNLQKYFWNP